MKNPPDPSYDPDYAEECCMSCGARQERGDGGSCNRCNGDYDEGREKSAVARLGKIAAWGDVLKPTLMGAGSIADRVTGSGQSEYAKELLEQLIGREKGGGDKRNRGKQASYSVVQNMAWVAAQEKVAHEKRANRWGKLLNAVVPAAKHEATQTGLGAGIGAATSPFVADRVGIETGAGKWGHLLSSTIAGAVIANPRTRKSMTHSPPWTRKGLMKADDAARKAFIRANPELRGSGVRKTLDAYRKATKGEVPTKLNPVKSVVMLGGAAVAPSTLGHFADPAKRFADKANDALSNADVAGKEITSPSTLMANFAYNMADQYGYDKKWVNDMGRNIGIDVTSSLMGGGLGSLLGGKLANMFSSVAIDEGDADYKNLDEAGYKKRRRKQKLKNLLWWAGHIGGGVAGGSLGAKYLPDKLRQMFPKKAGDMDSEITRLARLSAEKQAGIGIKPEVSKRLMGGLTGGAVGAGIGAVGTAAIDPLMDKLFKSPEQQIQEKARTTFLERLKARLIAGAAVGGGIGVAGGSGMKDMFQKT